MPHVVACGCAPRHPFRCRALSDGTWCAARRPKSPRADRSEVTSPPCAVWMAGALAWPAVVSSPQQSVLLIISIIINNQATVNTPEQLFCTICPVSLRPSRFQRFDPLHALLCAPASFEPPAGRAAGRGSGDAWTSISGPPRFPSPRTATRLPSHPAAPGQARYLPAPVGSVDGYASIGHRPIRPPGSSAPLILPARVSLRRPAACRRRRLGASTRPRAPDRPAFAPHHPPAARFRPLGAAAGSRDPLPAAPRRPGSASLGASPRSERRPAACLGGRATVRRTAQVLIRCRSALSCLAAAPAAAPRPAGPEPTPPRPPQFPPAPASARDLRRLHPLRNSGCGKLGGR